VTTVRLAAARVLLALDRGSTTLAAEVEQARSELSDPRDRALLLELTGGVLRWRGELDAVIAMASGRSVLDIDRRALAVLRLAVYQLRHLRIPAHAALHQAVETVRALRAPRAAGFVNGVLRSVQRRGASLKLPARPREDSSRTSQERYLAITLSHPIWLIRRWLDRYGFEATERWCQFNNAPPEIAIRSTGPLGRLPLLTSLQAAGLDARPSERVPDAIRLAPGDLGRIPSSLDGLWRVQDEGAQLVAHFAAARPGERVVDLCASPGGKTLVVASDMGLCRGTLLPRGSQLVSADYRSSRVEVLAATVRASRLPISIVQLDARQTLPFRPVFDLAVLDVPCSGLGTLRRDPDIKWRRQADELPYLGAEALEMLRQAAGVVRPGGRLVYATCSSEPEENQAVVQAFLDNAPQFTRRGEPLQTAPFLDGMDAFFAVTLVRRESA
jgi:16S rRNA (cytosine967-C5)-methyltransferase